MPSYRKTLISSINQDKKKINSWAKQGNQNRVTLISHELQNCNLTVTALFFTFEKVSSILSIPN